MSLISAKQYLKDCGFDSRIKEFDVSSATVELAALAVGCEPANIAKTLSFIVGDIPVLVVTAGDTKIDNAKFKSYFHTKAKMIPSVKLDILIGHEAGGVCPFGINDGVQVYLDESLKRFDYVYPACGSTNSAVKLSVQDLEQCSNYISWIDVSKLKNEC